MTDQAQKLFYKALGARIRQLRGTRFSQEQLATLIGLKRTSIVNIEAGEQKVLVHNLLNIAQALGVRSIDILSHLEPDDSPPHIEGRDVPPGVGQWMNRAISKAIQTTKR